MHFWDPPEDDRNYQKGAFEEQGSQTRVTFCEYFGDKRRPVICCINSTGHAQPKRPYQGQTSNEIVEQHAPTKQQQSFNIILSANARLPRPLIQEAIEVPNRPQYEC